ncbi:MFS transporter [Hydrogenophaga sp. R2]|uniref:MFS transporter n=1 Tax=Hydrogenophaga sp. R2 TaxID=3132827 RepID=UPI003CE9558F
MPLFSADALNPGVRAREVLGWALYDFANSGYTTVVLTAVFAAYFVGAVAGGESWATLAWTAALSASHLLVMLTMPGIGAWADQHAAKRRLLALCTLGCVLSTAALALVGPGAVALGVLLVVVSNTFFAWGESLAAAFLPELARPQAMGRVSGWGWSLGYVGGMLALGLSLAWVLQAQAAGQPASAFVPVTMLITAGLFAVAGTASLLLLREHATPRPAGPDAGLGAAWRQLGTTLRQARHYRDFMWLLACAAAYQGGVAVAIALAAIYAEQVVGFQPQQTMVLIFVLNIAAMAGAFAFGYGQDRLGHKKALALTLLGWMATCVLAALTTTQAVFWWAAAIAGLCMGSSQSAGRAMAGVLAPPAQLAEFFGLWTFATRVASIVGPLTYGAITWLTDGNHRLAIGSTALLFALGLLLLVPVDMERGRRAALAAPPGRNAG